MCFYMFVNLLPPGTVIKSKHFFSVTEQFQAAVGPVEHIKWKKVKALFICSLHFDPKCTCKCVCLSKTIKNSIRNCDLSTLKPPMLPAYPDENGNQEPEPDPAPDLATGVAPLRDHDYVGQVDNQPKSFEEERFEGEAMDTSEHLKKEYATLAEKERKVRQSKNRFKRLNRSLRAELKETLKSKKVTSDISYECSIALKRCKSEVPIKMFQALVTKRKRLKQYCPVLRKFAATQDLCSPRLIGKIKFCSY